MGSRDICSYSAERLSCVSKLFHANKGLGIRKTLWHFPFLLDLREESNISEQPGLQLLSGAQSFCLYHPCPLPNSAVKANPIIGPSKVVISGREMGCSPYGWAQGALGNPLSGSRQLFIELASRDSQLISLPPLAVFGGATGRTTFAISSTTFYSMEGIAMPLLPPMAGVQSLLPSSGCSR